MPLYEYTCKKHGLFEQLGSIAQRAASEPCPTCHRAAPRVLSVPQRPLLSAGTRIALDRNERSSFEPKIVKREAAAEPKRQRDVPPAPKRQAHTHGRPWMIGH
jgi:putative FmdB family regulatory protein